MKVNEKRNRYYLDVLMLFGSGGLGMAQYWLTYGTIESWTITKVSMYLFFFVFGLFIVCYEKVDTLRKSWIYIPNLITGIITMTISWKMLFSANTDCRFVWSDVPFLGGYLR